MRMPAFLERDRTFTEPVIWITTSVMVATHRLHHQNTDKDVTRILRGMAVCGPTSDGSSRGVL